ncbi:DUF805 domain-containing protein [Rhodoluna limnophila]|uniref:DUF805 domain-containing protein n=1 Tax=Rhodoluna limnophila TaxID=232537 RepID=UPI001105E93B|nr:DUF805 domain-containing protein [Rhodoluna limnophila]
MTFAGAIKVCLTKFADFRGVATRREYWYFVLFTVLVSLVLSTVDGLIFPPVTTAQDAFLASLEANPETLDAALLNAALMESWNATPISNLVGFILGIPLLAALVRRMRDAGFSAWWMLLSWVPLLTFIFSLLPTKTAEQGNTRIRTGN